MWLNLALDLFHVQRLLLGIPIKIVILSPASLLHEEVSAEARVAKPCQY